MSNYNFKLLFDPTLLFGEPFQYQNRVALEFNHLYHWHPLMPDDFNIGGTNYTIKDFLVNPKLVIKHGMANFVDSLSKQNAGSVSMNNFNFIPYHKYVLCARITISKRDERYQRDSQTHK